MSKNMTISSTAKYLLILTITILFAVFVHATSSAIVPEPQYSDYCDDMPRPYKMSCENYTPPQSAYEQCNEQNGQIRIYTQEAANASNESTSCTYECNTCSHELELARADSQLVYFIVSVILGLIAIIFGIRAKSDFAHAVGTGFVLGGLLSIYIATLQYYSNMLRVVRPFAIFIELLLVIYIAYLFFAKDKGKDQSKHDKKN